MELQHRLELTKLEAEKEVVAARDKAELFKLEAFLAEKEMSELTNKKEGIKWSPKVDEFHPKDKQVLKYQSRFCRQLFLVAFTPAPVSVINAPPPLETYTTAKARKVLPNATLSCC